MGAMHSCSLKKIELPVDKYELVAALQNRAPGQQRVNEFVTVLNASLSVRFNVIHPDVLMDIK